MITLKKTYIDNYKLIFLFTALLFISNSVQAVDNKLSVSVPSFAPFNSFLGHPQCNGVSVMALQEITKDLNVALTLKAYPYARILHSLKSAKLDLALIFKNTTISNEVDYIGPVSFSNIIILSQSDKAINNYDDLHNLKNIAVIRNAQFEEKFDQDKSLNKVSVDNYRQAVSMLKYKRIDAVIGSVVGIEYALHQEGMSNNILAKAFNLGKKEWGLHLTKSPQHEKLKPMLIKAVKQVYQEDLIHQLYRQQMQHCLISQQ